MLHTSQVKHVSVLSQWNNLKEQNELPSSSRFASCHSLLSRQNDEQFPAAVSCRGTDRLDPAYFKVLKNAGSMTHSLQKNVFKT